MDTRKVGIWGGSLSVRLGKYLESINVRLNEEVNVEIVDNKVVISKLESEVKQWK